MPEVKRKKERLVVMLVVGAIVLNYPLLALFSRIKLLFGIPILYLYIFSIWVFLIVGVALILEKPSSLSKPERSE